MNNEIEIDKLELKRVGGIEAVKFADKYKVNYANLTKVLVSGFNLDQIKSACIHFTNAAKNLLKFFKDTDLSFNKLSSAMCSGYVSNKKTNKYIKRCMNREKLYKKKIKIGKVKNKKR